MKRNTVLIVLVVVAAAVLFFNPLKLLQNRGAAARRPSADQAVLDPLLRYAESSYQTPENYVIQTLAEHDIVLLGEFYKIKQNVQLVSALVPRLAAAGVRNLGFEYALSDSQKDIDALLASPSWSEKQARGILIDWIATWGYQEYIDILEAAWKVNRGLPAGSPPFRVVGLNVRQNWDLLKTDSDARNPETVQRILSHGIPDQHMAQVIEREVTSKGEKALVFCGIQHSFTRYRSREYEKQAAEMKLGETRRAGNIVFDRIGGRAFTVMLHAPWPDKNERTGLAYAAGGAIDALIDGLPMSMKEAGYDTAGTPLGALPVTSASYLSGYKSLTLSDLCDGYVIQGPLADYQVVTPIVDFVPADRAEQAIRNFPGVKPPSLTLNGVNQAIVEDVKAVDGALAPFRGKRAR
jgi:hypothetical protein